MMSTVLIIDIFQVIRFRSHLRISSPFKPFNLVTNSRTRSLSHSHPQLLNIASHFKVIQNIALKLSQFLEFVVFRNSSILSLLSSTP
jgi:hypothetical protein